MSKKLEMTRRDFMGKCAAAGTGVLAAGTKIFGTPPSAADGKAQAAAAGGVDWAAVRADFPRADKNPWLANAETHPFHVHTLKAVETYMQNRTLGGPTGYTDEMQADSKKMFADLIGAKPNEIAFTMSTTDGENSVISGIDLFHGGGNVVIDDLHFMASKFMYGQMAKKGQIELRVVHHKDWVIRTEDMAAAIDKNTRLVSMALVSNINGYMHDAKAISDIAHANGALVYGDIIQGVGTTPLDMRAMGIDCAASSTYKWMMGDFGLGFLYVPQELQGTVVKQTRYGLAQVSGMSPSGEYEAANDASRYEGTTTMPYMPGICAYHGLSYVTKLGVAAIRAHAKLLTDRLQKEVPKLGFTSITPVDNPTPIVSFIASDEKMKEAGDKLAKAFPKRIVSISHWQKTNEKGVTENVTGMRLGVSVYNNDKDIDALLNALD
ncbi:MAG: aminotransferase class V-fold PLP-dependent enzyme [Candidatus Aminicenantales bacterium]